MPGRINDNAFWVYDQFDCGYSDEESECRQFQVCKLDLRLVKETMRTNQEQVNKHAMPEPVMK
jgi:hypothetical protein